MRNQVYGPGMAAYSEASTLWPPLWTTLILDIQRNGIRRPHPSRVAARQLARRRVGPLRDRSRVPIHHVLRQLTQPPISVRAAFSVTVVVETPTPADRAGAEH